MVVAVHTFATLAAVLGLPGNLTSTPAASDAACGPLVPEDATLPFLGLAAKYGHPGEAHRLTTEDGYELTAFRIPGKRAAPPVLLFHGVADSADTWIERGDASLAVALAREGHDLWFGNARGTQYSRGHVSPAVESDPARYWNFTFHEHGVYDLSATVDYVLSRTGARKLNGVGHSQGTTVFFVLCSTRPDYNAKLNLLTALAPVAYLHNTPPPISTLIRTSPILYSLGRSLDVQELFAEDSLNVQALRALCPLPVSGYALCALGIFFPISGFDVSEFEPCFLRVFVGHFPRPTSLKNLYHFAQVGSRRKFARYDYGAAGNMAAYNSSSPPEYDLSKVTARVALLVGTNDHLSTVADVQLLRRSLPNVVAYRVVPRPLCNHMDFVVGKNMASYLYPDIFDVIRLYGGS